MGTEKYECETLIKCFQEIYDIHEKESKEDALRRLFEMVILSDDFDYVLKNVLYINK